jgi:hypothetical protein
MKSLPVIDEKFLDEQLQMLEKFDEAASNPWEARVIAAILIAVTAFSIYMATK